MQWVLSPGFLAEVLAVVAVVVLVPSAVATFLVVQDGRAGRVRIPVRILAGLAYALSALVVAAVIAFLLVNHVRIEDVRLL